VLFHPVAFVKKVQIKRTLTRTLRNLLILFLGVGFAWLFLELALLLYGRTQRFLQEKNNVINDNDEFVILCLGESTTASMYDEGKDISWPAALQASLNEVNLGKKIKVINEGIVGINSTIILDHLDENLAKYHPDLVIAMMGTNDYGVVQYETTADIKTNSGLPRSKVYRLIKFLIQNLKDKQMLQAEEASNQEVSCDSEASCVNLAILLNTDKLSERTLAIQYFQMALNYNRKNTFAMTEIARLYALPGGNLTESLKYFRTALNYNHKDPYIYSTFIRTIRDVPYDRQIIQGIISDIKFYGIENSEVFSSLADYYEYYRNPDDPKMDENRLFYLKRAYKLDLDNPLNSFALARYYREHGDLLQAEDYYLETFENKEKGVISNMAITELAQFYQDTGKQKLADFYWQEVYQPENKYTYNYQQLYEKLHSQGIAFMAMQYPMRSIKPLEIMFNNKDGVFIVGNEQSFKDLVQKKNYYNVFLDAFAGDFGHCTLMGNQLLAANVKSVILDNWNLIAKNISEVK
jgi:tetratricopeptide (TPR) repeat protein